MCHTGQCPVGITTQDERLIPRLPVEVAAERVENFLNALTLECQMFARACGKQDVHDLEPEDLRAMTLESSMITGIPLVGTDVAFGAPWAHRMHVDGSGHLPTSRPRGRALAAGPLLVQLAAGRAARARRGLTIA